MEWMALGRKKWAYGVVAAAMIAIFAVTIPNLYNSVNPNLIEKNNSSLSIPNTGSGGTGLTSLKTVILQTPEEAKQLFGPDLLVLSFVPEGYQCTEIQAIGTEKNTATQVIFTYTSGNQVFTLVEDKTEASLNFDYFDPIKVDGVDGYMNKDPAITELYWLNDGIQFSIIGSLSKKEAINVAESLH